MRPERTGDPPGAAHTPRRRTHTPGPTEGGAPPTRSRGFPHPFPKNMIDNVVRVSDEREGRGAAGVVVGGPTPLSSSQLWAVNAAYYEDSGVSAWASGEVPHLLTSGPMMARSYAQMIEGYARDAAAGRLGAVDPDEPLYVIELGAGPGRLGFYLLNALDPEATAPFHVVYVLSDLAEKNVAFWHAHPRLAALVAAGRLDFARFDASVDAELTLQVSDVRLSSGSLANPLVVCANYLFDVLPQDLFAMAGGEPFEEEIVLCSEEPATALGDEDFLDRLFLATERRAVRPDRFGGGSRDELLDRLASEGDGRLLFPSVPLLVIERLLELSGDRLLLLVGERPGAVPEQAVPPELVEKVAGRIPEIPAGPVTIDVQGVEAVRPGALLAMGIHGHSFSLPVDLDILSRPILDRGGSLLLPEALPAGLIVGAMLSDGGGGDETRRSFAQAIADLGPEDLYLTIRAALDEPGEGVNLAMLLAVMRVGGYDPYLLRRIYVALERELVDAADEGLDEAVRVLRRVLELEFPIDDDTDVAYGIAVLLAPARRYEDALYFFARSRERHGPRPVGQFNVALCHLHLGEAELALLALDEAIALDPEYGAARELRDAVLEERASAD